MSLQQVIWLKTSKKCPRNGRIMSQTTGRSTRERGDHGHISKSRARMWGRGARPHPMVTNEMHIQKEGSPTHLGHPPPLYLSSTPFCPLFSLFLVGRLSLCMKGNSRCSCHISLIRRPVHEQTCATKSSHQPLQGDVQYYYHLIVTSASILGCTY